MVGRQAHGRPVGGAAAAPRSNNNSGSKGGNKKRSKAKALDAFAIASAMYAEKPKNTPRNRELDVPTEGPRRGKHARDEDDDDDEDGDEDDDDEDSGRPRKIRRGAEARDGGGKDEDGDRDVEYSNDSSGNEWRVGAGDDDSDIESDDAFGESDEEKFQGYSFRGSNKKADDEDDDEDDADGASLGSDAIDLADALDMSMSEDEAEPGDEQDDSSGEDESDSSESGSSDASSDVDNDDEDDNISESGVNAWVSRFSGVKDADKEDDGSTTTKPKIGLKDLGLLTVKDPQLKKSVKLMGKEAKESAKKQKLDVPLARRQQARLDRSVAYEKTNETLDRWTETVKHNRRAEHLVFPLPQTETGLIRHDNTELQPITSQAPGNELEQTIMAIMEESGLGPSAKKESKKTGQGDEAEEGQTISRGELKDLWNKRRQEREAKSREEARAKRIKKIKSKAYHRVHRKQRERDEMKEREIMAASGELDSEEEREALDRQRAAERMGSRHRESKWAKMRKGDAVWDDDVRTGLTDMARRDEELRRRIEGRSARANGDGEEDDSEYSDDDDEDGDERKRLLKQLDAVSKDDDSVPKSKLMSMAFMQKAEAARKQANDEMIAEIRRDLASDDDEGGSEAEPDDVGRRQFGQLDGKKSVSLKEQPREGKKNKKAKAGDAGLQGAADSMTVSANGRSKGLSAPVSHYPNAEPSTAGAWSQPTEAGPARKQKGKKAGSGADVLDFGVDSVAVAPAAAPPKPAKKQKKPQNGATTATADAADSDEDESHLIQFREQELLDRAFGGLDVVADFEREKREIAEEDDDKVVDNTLPGWGSWVGDGVSRRQQRRHQGRFLEKKEGVKQKQNRQDAKLKNVIINEKRIRKSEKYMAAQLPHVYESKLQYERSLRLPLGPEFQTRETFQEVTKPRVLLKQGIVAPIAKPTY